jgi:hypothetical protein
MVPFKQNSLIFLAALTLHHVMVRSISGHYRSGRGYFRAAACAAKKRTTDAKEKHLRALQAKSKESPMAHKLNGPHEWLLEKAQHWNTDALYKALSDLACRLDGQSIRDLFHSEMDSDGYFDKKTKPNADAFEAESWGSHRWHT